MHYFYKILPSDEKCYLEKVSLYGLKLKNENEALKSIEGCKHTSQELRFLCLKKNFFCETCLKSVNHHFCCPDALNTYLFCFNPVDNSIQSIGDDPLQHLESFEKSCKICCLKTSQPSHQCFLCGNIYHKDCSSVPTEDKDLKATCASCFDLYFKCDY
jgi:hypothetical protein